MSDGKSNSRKIALTDGSLMSPLTGDRPMLNGDKIQAAYLRAKASVGTQLLKGAPEKVLIAKRRNLSPEED